MVARSNYTAPLADLLKARENNGLSSEAPATSRALSATDAIKELILRENLGPGDSLPTEKTLCETLGVSRSSVREAIRKLEALDIVNAKHGSGTFVGSLSLDPLVQTLAFRSALSCNEDLEGLRYVVEVRRFLDMGCAHEVVTSLAGTKQPHLQKLVESMISHANAGKPFQEEDIQFHIGILKQISNPVIEQLVHSLWIVHMATIPRLDIAISSRLLDTAQAHQRLLDAALAGDIEAYRNAVADHYDPLREILIQSAQNNQENFTIARTKTSQANEQPQGQTLDIQSLIHLPSDSLIACFQVNNYSKESPLQSELVFTTSANKGQSWSERTPFGDTAISGTRSNPSLLFEPNSGKLLCWYTESNEESFWRATTSSNGISLCLAVSENEGKTWKHKTMSSIRPRDVAGMITLANSSAVMSDGTLVQSFLIRKHGNTYAVCASSVDGGEKWILGDPVGPGVTNLKLTETSQGRLLAVIESGKGITELLSSDGGLRFNQTVDTKHSIMLSNIGGICQVNRSLLLSGYIKENNNTYLCIQKSTDDGHSWSAPRKISISAADSSPIIPIEHEKAAIAWNEPSHSKIEYTVVNPAMLAFIFPDIHANRQEQQLAQH